MVLQFTHQLQNIRRQWSLYVTFYHLYANIYALVANPSDVIGVVVWPGNAAVVEPKNNLSIWIISFSGLLVCGDVL